MARTTDQRRWIGEEAAQATVTGHHDGTSPDGPKSGETGFGKPAANPAILDNGAGQMSGVKTANAAALPEPSDDPFLPEFDAGNFTAGQPIDNPYFPFHTGTIFSYGTLPDEEDPTADIERNDTFFTYETKQIAGVTAFVVRDTAYLNGMLVEDTLDWYAQDDDGNVWYMGELSYNYRYDEDGNYLSTDTNGSWTADGQKIFPGYIMPSPELFSTLTEGYYQEFAPRTALDQADILTLKASIELDEGVINGALATLDTTQLEPEVREKKYYEPGIGLVLTEDFENGVVEQTTELLGVRLVGGELMAERSGFRDKGDLDLKDFADNGANGSPALDQPEIEDFTQYQSGAHVTYLGGETDSNNALGVYTYDLSSGIIEDVRFLFTDADEVAAGTDFFIDLDAGEGFGLFLVPDGGDLGLDLGKYEDGGLSLINFTTHQAANINDGLAPLFAGKHGTILPIPGFHALDTNTDDDYNLLNLDGAIHAIELRVPESPNATVGDIDVIGFEDMFATDPLFDGDYDDLVIAISQDALAPATVAGLVNDLTLAGGDGLAL